MALESVRALVFDVFGTVVDWRGSIIAQGERFAAARGLSVDWSAFVHEWRMGYQPAMERVRSGQRPWANIDTLHREILDGLLPRFGLDALGEDDRAELNRAWHRLDPWPDAVGGLERLRQRFIVTTLSNGNMSLLVDLGRHGGLRWDCVLSAELAGHYKPEPEAYLMVSRLLDLPPERLMMVAAHAGDLHAARGLGMRTAYVRRPQEYGPYHIAEDVDPTFDVIADDFEDLADRLGAP